MRQVGFRDQSLSSRPLTTVPWGGAARTAHPDPFAINPIRRSLTLVVVSGAAFFGPLAAGGEVGATALLVGGWLGLLGLAIGLPVLGLSLIEWGWEALDRSLRPRVDVLPISDRLVHVLRRHGYHSIVAVERVPDAALLLLSNMTVRDVREIRRAVSLWHYRRWQEQGFP